MTITANRKIQNKPVISLYDQIGNITVPLWPAGVTVYHLAGQIHLYLMWSSGLDFSCFLISAAFTVRKQG